MNSKLAIYNLRFELSGRLYYKFLDYSEKIVHYALLVVQASHAMNNNLLNALNIVNPFLYKVEKTNKWPGTELFDKVAFVYKYDVNTKFISTLKGLTDRLYGWNQPNLPEDFCLLRENGKPWLVTISHEKDGYLYLSKAEYNDLLENFGELSQILIKEC